MEQSTGWAGEEFPIIAAAAAWPWHVWRRCRCPRLRSSGPRPAGSRLTAPRLFSW